MGKYKILKSVAHNWGCSFLSLEYFSKHGYLVQALADFARERNAQELEINILECETSLGQPINNLVQGFIKQAAPSFFRILEAQGCFRQMVKDASLSIRYESLDPFPKVSEVCLRCTPHPGQVELRIFSLSNWV